ncbi:MAG: ABC transporter permease [Armatimonadota bacterium]|nr:ABC transporter permease [Armatimonadota bacterium]MDR7463535.1 ABC transporter permease [Armatimonadota bacterium]MDR7469108.1 ABC transporter permease [Armatimonadota bacterium]MDR7539202.1 ABC transporter permease [Armatimonadota bacterium]
MNLTTYIARRLALMVLVVFGVLVITFIVSHVIPADPVLAILGGNAPAEKVDALRRELGLDKPLHQQFVAYIWGAVRGDLGRSLRTGRPVWQDIQQYFPATVELTFSAIFLAIILGIPLGVVSAIRRNQVQDHTTRVFSIVGVSMPVFWTGLVLLLLFYYRLGWLPGPGRLDLAVLPPPNRTRLLIVDSLLAGDWVALRNAVAHLIMPAFVLGYVATATIARVTRSSMLDILHQDYIRTARSKGLVERVVILRHALRNALIPTVTVIGLVFGGLLEGSVLTETVFAWPGLGRYITTGYISLDYPAVMGGTLYIAVVFSLVNLIVDLTYAFLDPRIRL